ncbi:UvrD-helicase domain-containing protein [Psychroflexus montanilacus]|uniref:UvrD-helicase domain-containing protein n=1 Tax=Psychroflexus montanilacus TaxID=2873598 RepID=UPI001CCFC5BC|nr:UvrD-helicase domain-containing protein [Psychroflexus montanilacus]MBZ9652668.1 UvrD-helicase domain-containing protein [Psychroflexus montanilacus]
MGLASILLLTSVILFLGIIAFLILRKRLRLKREEEERVRIEKEKKRLEQLQILHNRQREELIPFIPNISDFNSSFEELKAFNKYISNYDVFVFKDEFDYLYRSLKDRKYEHLPDFKSSIEKISSFLTTFSNIDSLLGIRNKKFVDKELKETESLLDDVEGKSLDIQQRKAVIINQDNHLVIAGAGSGKTTTIAGKVKYLVKRQNISPDSILLISFTRKSADEMRDRIDDKMNIDVPVKTFNKLGLDIISEVNNLKPSIYESSGKPHLERISSFIDYAKESHEYYSSLIEFFSFYLKPYKDISDFESDSEHNNYLNEQKLEGYKLIDKKTSSGVKITYREKFKSQEEVLIANYLFLNNVKYEYEENYKYKTASKKFGQYKPDFYLPEYDIYIEHFGVDENWDVPEWFKGKNGESAKETYNKGIEWKRQEHKKNNTILVESYSWQQRKGILLPELQKSLEKNGVVFKPISNDEFWSYIQKNAKKDIDDFTQLIDTFLVLLKSNNETISNLLNKAEKEDDIRARKFLKLFEPIFNSYQEYLLEKEEIDFSDMINHATELIQSNNFESKFDYIIIDEFQDISKARFQLIKSLLDQKPGAKLFCVGDDWQSIYRFAGSDIGLFTGFDDKFKNSPIIKYSRKTHKSFIEYTYRFNNKLIDLTSDFILKNPNQISKTLKSHFQSEECPYSIFKYSDPERNSENLHNALRDALSNISEKVNGEHATVLLLGRYDFERRNFVGDFLTEIFNKKSNQHEYVYKGVPNLKIRFLTAHRSKGLQDDFVVITNCSSGTYGFPSEISDDPLLNFLLSKADQFPNGEERRLFYVAVTRARKHVCFLVNEDYTSKFIDEIDENEKNTTLQCEWCDNGKLIERNGKLGYFYACNNNHYCNYTRKIRASDFKSLAYEYYENNQFNSALEYFQKYLSQESGDSSTFYYLGKCYEEKKDFQNALHCYNDAISLDISNANAFYWRGSIQYDLKNYDEAVKDWLSFNKLRPNSKSVNYWLAKGFLKSRRSIESIRHINKEIEENPVSEDAVILKNQILNYLKKRYTTKEIKVNSKNSNILKGYLELAIDFDVDVKFNYHKSKQFNDGITSLRTIKPDGFKVIGQYDSLCVFGYCYMREEERVFKLERISELIINPNEIEYWSN